MSSMPAPVSDYAGSKTPSAAPLPQSGVCIWDAFGGFACPAKTPMAPGSMPSAALFEGFYSASAEDKKKPLQPAAPSKVPEGFCGCSAGADIM